MEPAATTYSYYGTTGATSRSWGSALVASSSLYVAAIVGVVALGAATQQVMQEKPLDVSFVEKVVAPPPPPPPPMPEVVADVPPPAAAPVIPKNMKVRQLDKPPPRKELAAPKEMPKEAPKEADPSQDKGIAVYGEVGDGDPAGLEGGVKGGSAGGRVGAISLPEDAEPPVSVASNALPTYPAEARADGKTGVVVLKVVVNADGSVGEVSLMRGDEPFASTAIAAVRKWKYEPAKYHGQAITVFHVVKIPFKLTV